MKVALWLSIVKSVNGREKNEVLLVPQESKKPWWGWVEFEIDVYK